MVYKSVTYKIRMSFAVLLSKKIQDFLVEFVECPNDRLPGDETISILRFTLT